MSRVRWGVLSTAKIGVKQVIPAMQRADSCDIVAIASRSQGKAAEVASSLGIPKSYGSYEALLADDEIDAIYNPLPNNMHVEWSIKALQAGKHVLCEKPIGLTSVEAQHLVDEAAHHPELKVMEAFMYRFHPQWQKTKALVSAGKIGELKSIQSFFSYFNDNEQNIRNQKDLGGGALMDVGCYNISLSRFLFGEEPTRVLGLMDNDSRFDVDRTTSGILQFAHGTSTFTCSMQLASHQRANVLGTEGRIEIEIPFNAPPDSPCKIWHHYGDSRDEIELEICDQYTIQGELFSQAVLNSQPALTPLIDAVQNMKVLEAIVESVNSSAWIRL